MRGWFPLDSLSLRLFKRTVRRVFTREELWGGNRETFREQFFSRDSLFVWAAQSHPKLRREYPAELAKPDYAHLAVHRFRSPREVEVWLK